MNDETIEKMKLQGAGFASKLARAWEAADSENRKKIEATFADIFDRYAEPEWLTIPPPYGFVDLGMGPIKRHKGDDTCWICEDLNDWTAPIDNNFGTEPDHRYAARIGSVTAALNDMCKCEVYGYTEEGEEIIPPEGWEIVPEGEEVREGDKFWSRSCQWTVESCREGCDAKTFSGIRAYARRKQPETVPLEAKDWAGGPWWVMEENNTLAHAVASVCILDGDVFSNCKWVEASELAKNWQRSTDLVSWQPCTKEAK